MLINFSMFVDAVENGSKPHTIRRCNKRRPPLIGERLYLYEGLRTKAARRLHRHTGGVVFRCSAVQPIKIELGAGVWLNGAQLPGLLVRLLAYQDGFRRAGVADVAAFWQYFCPGLTMGETFNGYLISWAPHTLATVGGYMGAPVGTPPPPAVVNYADIANDVEALAWADTNNGAQMLVSYPLGIQTPADATGVEPAPIDATDADYRAPRENFPCRLIDKDPQ